MGIGARLLARLDEEFPRPQTALHHTTTLQLLVATILSAQCTDERVNQVTKTLFAVSHGAGLCPRRPGDIGTRDSLDRLL